MVVNLLNSLPLEVVEANRIARFNKKLDTFMNNIDLLITIK